MIARVLIALGVVLACSSGSAFGQVKRLWKIETDYTTGKRIAVPVEVDESFRTDTVNEWIVEMSGPVVVVMQSNHGEKNRLTAYNCRANDLLSPGEEIASDVSHALTDRMIPAIVLVERKKVNSAYFVVVAPDDATVRFK